jgi:hypothetical protein
VIRVAVFDRSVSEVRRSRLSSPFVKLKPASAPLALVSMRSSPESL